MLISLKFLTVFLFLPVWGCAGASKADGINTELAAPSATPETIAAPQTIEPAENDKLFVFVGEKIGVEYIPPAKEEIPFDSSYTAKYKVIQNVYNDLGKDIVEFVAFDHYGVPGFAKHRTVLIFITEHKGKLYHEKYQYFDVNQTNDGRWASCGDPYRFDDYHRKKFESAVLAFNEPVTFEIEKLKPGQVKEIYPEPFFKIEGNRAVCKMGAFVEDLFYIKKNGVLKARGLFK